MTEAQFNILIGLLTDIRDSLKATQDASEAGAKSAASAANSARYHADLEWRRQMHDGTIQR